MAHALGGVLAMLFWIWFRRRYGGRKTGIAFAILIALNVLLAVVFARADNSSEKQRSEEMVGKHCGILLGPQWGEKRDDWTPRRQKLCEHLVNGGRWRELHLADDDKLLDYIIKHTK